MSFHTDMKLCAQYVVRQLDTGPREDLPQPGDFVTRLIDTMCIADTQKLGLLRMSFPLLGEAVHIYKNTWDGANVLRQRAGIELNPAWPQPGESERPDAL